MLSLAFACDCVPLQQTGVNQKLELGRKRLPAGCRGAEHTPMGHLESTVNQIIKSGFTMLSLQYIVYWLNDGQTYIETCL